MNTIIEKIKAEVERLQHTDIPHTDEWWDGADYVRRRMKEVLSDLEKEEKPMNPVCESKFKVGDRIQFKGFGHNKYTIAKVNVDDNRYVDTSGNGMDMSYTDANFELVKEQPVCEELDYKNWDDLLTEEMIAWHKKHFKGKRKWEETSGEYLEHSSQLDLARHFAQWGADHFRDTTKKVEGLEEAAKAYADDINSNECLYTYTDFTDAFKAGAQWQKEKDERTLRKFFNDRNQGDASFYDLLAYREGHRDGMEEQKEQMMKEAVTIDTRLAIWNGEDFKCALWNILTSYGVIDGSKFKMIIIKED